MRHPTYKHLEARLRIGAFSVGQWVQISLAGTAAAVFGVYISPFPTGITTFVSVLGAGLPVAVSYGAMGMEFSVGQFMAAGWRYVRRPRRYMPGPGTAATGYLAEEEPSEVPPEATTPRRREVELWDL